MPNAASARPLASALSLVIQDTASTAVYCSLSEMAILGGRWLRLLSIIFLSVLILLTAVVAALQIPAVATWTAQRLLTLVPLNDGYRLEVDAVSGDWLTKLILHDVRLLHDNRTLAHIGQLEAEYNALRLLGSETRIRSVWVDSASILTRRQGDSWDLAEAFGGEDDTTAAGGRTFAVERLDLEDVQLAAELTRDSVVRVRDLTLRAEDLILGDRVLLQFDTLHATIIPPGEPQFPVEVAASGAKTEDVVRLDSLNLRSRRSTVAGRAVLPLTVDGPGEASQLDLRLRASPLSLEEVAAFYPGVTPEGELWLEVNASAEGRLVTTHVTARLEQSSARLEAATMLGSNAPALYRLSGELTGVDPSELFVHAPSGSLTGEVHADLQGQRLAVASGTAALRLRDSRLSGSAIESLNLAAEVTRGKAELELDGDLEQARATVEGWMLPFDSVPSYQLSGTVRRIRGAGELAGTLAGQQGNPDLRVRFSIGGRGSSLENARLSGRMRFAAVPSGGDPVPLGHTRIRLADGLLRAHPELLVADGRVSATLVATLGDTIRYELSNGTIESVNLAALLGDTLAGPVSGSFAVQGRGITPQHATATARLRLDELRYAERTLAGVTAGARLRRGRVTLDMHGELQGGSLGLKAFGRPFDTPVTFSVDSAKLERVDLGALFGRPDLSGPVTLHASGSGRWSKSTRLVSGKVVVEPSRLGNVDVAAAAVSAKLAGGRLTYEATVRTSGGSLALAGDGRPLDSVPNIRVQRGRLDSLDIGELLGRADLATELDARFTATANGTALDTMSGRLDLELLRSRVNDARLGPGRVELSLAGGQIEGQVRLDGPDAHLAADLSGDLTGEIRQVGAVGTLRLEQLARWTNDSSRQGRLEGKFDLRAAADSAGLVTASGTVSAVGGLGGVRLQSLHAVLEPAPGAIVFDTLMVRSNVGVLDGSGSLALRDHGAADTLRLVGQTGDVNALADLAGIDSLTLDSAGVDLTITGTSDSRRIGGEVLAHRLLYSSTLVEQLEANAMVAIDSTGFGAIAGELQLQGLATGSVTVHEAQIAGRYDSLVSLEGTADLGEGVSVGLGLKGEIRGDTTSLSLGRLRLTEGGRDWGLAAPASVAIGPTFVRIHDFRLQSPERRVALQGILGLRDESDIALRIDNLELGALENVGIAPVPGRLDGTIRLMGPAPSPTMAGRLTLTLHDGEEENLGRIESVLEWTRRGLRIDAVAAHQQRGRLVVEGVLPWGFTLAPEDTTRILAVVREPGDSIHLTVRADSFETALLRPFIPPDVVRQLRGELAADARIRGTPEKPRADGSVLLRQVAFELPALDVTYQRGRLSGALSGDVLRIDTLLLHTGRDQQLGIQGEIRLRPLTNPALHLTGRLDEFVVSNSAQLKARASGQIRLGGTLAAPVLTGRVRVGQAEYFATGAAGLDVEDVELTAEDRLELARHFGPSVLERADEGGGFLDRFRLDLDLLLPSQVWFRRPEAPELNVEVAGRIRLRQEPGGEMRFFGAVEPVPGRSTLDVYGRTFQLTGGDIVLNGPVEETLVDVTAEYHVPTQGAPDNEGVVVNVAATGRPDSIGLEFSSEPEMPQDDMISYIVTGRPSSDNPLVERAGDGTGGGELALSQLTEAVSGAVGQELGFDVFQIRQDGTRGLILTAGRYLTPEFYVSLQQPLELSGQNDLAPGSNLGPGFELQYRMQPWLRALIQGGSLPSGVLLRGRYAY